MIKSKATVMYKCSKYQKGIMLLLVFCILEIFFAKVLLAQIKTDSLNESNSEKSQFQKSHVAIELIASVLPGANITKESGTYELKSRLQNSYDLGINYVYNFSQHVSLVTGFHVLIGTRNFQAKIPYEDFIGYNLTGTLYVSNRDIWGSIRIPFMIQRKITKENSGSFSIKGGFSLRYSGFMTDESVGGSVILPTNQTISYFSGIFESRKKVWATFCLGGDKSFILSNRNILSLGVLADISNTAFFKGNYQIFIPGQSATTGSYALKGSSIGLLLSYTFTGVNKRLARKYISK
jgi:hypothetical protein